MNSTQTDRTVDTDEKGEKAVGRKDKSDLLHAAHKKTGYNEVCLGGGVPDRRVCYVGRSITPE